MKAKIKCVGIVSRGLSPQAVITASIKCKDRDGRAQEATYLYMPYDDWMELRLLDADGSEDRGMNTHGFSGGKCRAPDGYHGESLPTLMRESAIDIDTGAVGTMTGRIAGAWINGEALWVRSDFATVALAALATWRERHDDLPSDRIAAPNWIVMATCKALALASGMIDAGKAL